jgi:hypothetical protein
MAILSIYCSGSIMKGSVDEKKLCWTDVERHWPSVFEASVIGSSGLRKTTSYGLAPLLTSVRP